MASNIVAFIGYESFDIILYLSRLLQKLNRKVLVIDYNGSAALTYSIPKVEGIDTFDNIITFRQVDFTRRVIDDQIAEVYDDILIDCGYNAPKFSLSLLTKVIYVSNMFKYNLKRIRHITDYDTITIRKELLIREASDIKISAHQMSAMINKQIPDENISILYRDEDDYLNALICHYNQDFRFTKISTSLKKYLLNEAVCFVNQAVPKEFKTAYRKAKKGIKR